MPSAHRAIDVLYVPSECGSIIPGKSKAAQAFRDADIVEKLKAAGCQIVQALSALSKPATHAVAHDRGKSGVRNEAENIDVCKNVDAVLQYILHYSYLKLQCDTPAIQLILGGECCMAPAIVSAFWKYHRHTRKKVGLIYIDADTDLAKPSEPGTGVFASMSVTHLVQHSDQGALASMDQFSRNGGGPVCDSSNMVFFGTNLSGNCASNKIEHLAYLFDNNYKVVSAAAVAKDPEARAKDVLRYMVEEKRVELLLVHLDVDSIDPVTFPLANVPNYTGVEFGQMMKALRVFLGSEKLAALTIAEVNPDHDPDGEMVGRLTDEVVSMLAERQG